MRRRKLKISSQDLRYVLAFMVASTIVASSIAYVGLNPPPSGQFFAMYILGPNGLAERYYPEDNSNITIGEAVNWSIGIYNHMGSLQYVVVRVKLLNSTLSSPNATTGTPSQVTPLLEYARVLANNETWSIPFVWRILSLVPTGRELLVAGISINQFTLTGSLASAVSGISYRFVFELWFYDSAADDLTFSWHTQSAQYSVWTQIWFNATLSTRPG